MRTRIIRLALLFSATGALRPPPSAALPVFARIYDKPCGTCHTVFPQLNPEGENFRAHGFHGLPPAVTPMHAGPLLDVPGTLPLALYLGTGEDVTTSRTAGESNSTRARFNLQFLSVLAGGELGPHLAFLVDYEVLESEPDIGRVEVNSLPEQAYLQAHVERFGWLGNLRAGWFELPLGTSPRVHRLSAQPYLTYALSGCSVLGRAPPAGRCEDQPVLSESQIGIESSALHPATGLGLAVGVTNGSNNRLADRTGRDVYLRVSQQIGLHKVGFFLLYSPDAVGAGPNDRTLRLGPDFTWYTRRFRMLGQMLANFESNPTGHSNDLWYYGAFLEGEYRLTATVLGLARAEYAWTPRFDDTGDGGETRVRRRLWAATGGAQWLLLENLKLVAEATYGESHDALTNRTSATWSVTVRGVTAFWALKPLLRIARWSSRDSVP